MRNPEGLMTVRIATIETELASASLAQKLADAGWTVKVEADRPNRILLKWGDGREDSTASVADLLTGFILTDWLYEYIHRRVGVLHPYLDTEQQEYVALLVLHGLRHEDAATAGWTWEPWRSRLDRTFEEVLGRAAAGSIHVSVDSILRFRARGLMRAAEASIDEVVRQFLSDQEYEEFVAMLRYILDAQSPSQQVLHVFCSDERIWLCDEEGNLVRDREVSAAAVQASEGEDVHAEDLAMSILITRAPCRIILHDLNRSAPWPTFAETVERVFQDRVRRCDHCTTCAELRTHLDDPAFAPGEFPPAMPNRYD
jgi:putative sporulation protein YtxC